VEVSAEPRGCAAPELVELDAIAHQLDPLFESLDASMQSLRRGLRLQLRLLLGITAPVQIESKETDVPSGVLIVEGHDTRFVEVEGEPTDLQTLRESRLKFLRRGLVGEDEDRVVGVAHHFATTRVVLAEPLVEQEVQMDICEYRTDR